jgi:hypothetical protein
MRRLARTIRHALPGACLLALLLAPRAAEAHPIHSSLTEIRHDAAARTLNVSVRVFADDFGVALQRRGGPPRSWEAAAFAYAATHFILAEGRRVLPFTWCGARRQGIVVWLCLRAPAPAATGRLVVHNRIHFELFEDQVNVVQATLGGRRQSVLFTRGDGPKPLR